jgi:hypothetical protein
MPVEAPVLIVVLMIAFEIGRDDRCSFGGQSRDRGPTDPATGPSDQRDLPNQSPVCACHYFPPQVKCQRRLRHASARAFDASKDHDELARGIARLHVGVRDGDFVELVGAVQGHF